MKRGGPPITSAADSQGPSGVMSRKKPARSASVPGSALRSQEVPPCDNGLAGSELFRPLSAPMVPGLASRTHWAR